MPLRLAWAVLVLAVVLATAREVASQAALTHLKTCVIADGSNPLQIQCSDWNATHRFAGGSHGALLVRDTGQPDGANWTTTPAPTAVLFGSTPASSGAIRFSHGGSLVARDSGNTADETIVSFGVVAADDTALGGTTGTTRIRSSLATPSALADGQWWVDCAGASPSRVCATKVRDQGVTRTIASVTF